MPAPALRSKRAGSNGLRAVVLAGGVGTPMAVNGEVRIPAEVSDLASFRRWVCSDQFPERGRFSYLAGELWVDLSMEQLFSHNRVKGEFAIVIGGLVKSSRTGIYFHDRALLSNPDVDLSTEPDGLVVLYETLRADRVRLVEGAEEGYVELEGTPDMVLEVVSSTSVPKDTVRLRDLYWRAGIPEYWFVDARGAQPRFEILHRGVRGYVATRRQAGWLRSGVFGQAFQLSQQPDPLGHPEYTLAVKP
jgi:Uma2 family endonuclease